MKKLNIWILTGELPQYHTGGIARYVVNAAEGFTKLGHTVTIICQATKNCNTVDKNGIRTVTFKPNHSKQPYRTMGYLPALALEYNDIVEKLCKELPKPDIIECQEYNAIGYYIQQNRLLKTSSLTNVPFLVHLHTMGALLHEPNKTLGYELPNYWHGRMERFSILAADRILSPSQLMADLSQAIIDQEINVDIIPHSVGEYAEETPPKLNGKNNEITFIGRLQVFKGVLELLKVCDKLWNENVDFKLKLIGGGHPILCAEDCRTDEYIKKHYQNWINKGKLILLGEVEHEKLIKETRASDITIIPSIQDNFPNTCMEAMSLGKVVITSAKVGNSIFIKNGKSGLIFDWEKEGDCEKSIKKALALSPEERNTMGQLARREILQACCPESIIQRRIEHFNQIIESFKQKKEYPITYKLEGPNPILELSKTPTKKQKDLVSVVIPFYNLGNTLEETIQSIDQSTYEKKEIIIINDGSTDTKSIEILNRLRQTRKDIKIYDKKNEGLALARNYGGKRANGEFVLFLDADDLIESNYIEKCVSPLKLYPDVTFVYTWVQYFDGATDTWVPFNMELPYLLAHNMSNASAIIRTEAFLKYGQNDEKLEHGYEDYDMWISIVKNGGKGICIPELLFKYRIRKSSMLRSISQNGSIWSYDYITQKHSELYKKYGAELFKLLTNNGPSINWNSPAYLSPYRWNQLEQERSQKEKAKEAAKKEAAKAEPAPQATEEQTENLLPASPVLESKPKKSRFRNRITRFLNLTKN